MVVIGGGTVDVTQATGGLEAEHITIAGGATSVVTSDDGVNASSSDDAAQGGGTADPDLLVTISGGELIAVGSSGMAEAPSADSDQSFVALTLDAAEQAGSVVHVVDADGTVLASFTASKAYSSVVYSSAEFTSGATYMAMVGGTAGSEDLAGLSHGGSTSGASTGATGAAGEESSGMRGGQGHSRG